MFKFDRYRMLVVFIGVTGLVISSSSCGDRKIRTGHIHDSAVQGLFWSTDSESGMTGVTGDFVYHEGDTVSFSLGAIQLGSAEAGRNLTIVNLVEGATSVTNNEVTNIARLLQTLDDDGDLENGITITEFVTLQATEDLNFDLEPSEFEQGQIVIDFLARVSINALRSAEDAQDHLSETIDALDSVDNISPIADADVDQSVESGDEVTLSGSGSDEDGSIVGHTWTKDSNNTVDVTVVTGSSDGDTFTDSFTAPQVDTSTRLTFILTVHDDVGGTGTDEVVITVTP
ncbi:MAG: hypothetical protein JKY67_17655 [Pseudomonadales bacterium]|nr:hypothetical protein [Pseudomonadales bacterium]